MSKTTQKIETKTVVQHKLPTGVWSVTLSADEKLVYAACADGVYELDVESGEYQLLYQHQSYVSGIARIDKPNTLISASYDGTLKWFDLLEESVIRTVKAHKFWSWSMSLSPDAARIASVTGQYLAGSYEYKPKTESEPSVKIFDALTGELLHSLPHVPSVQAVAFSPDSRYVAAGNLMGEIRVWDAISGDLVNQWTSNDFTSWGIIKSHCYIGGVFAIHFSPDSEHLLAAGMGPMRDPMAGNGKQLWQKFAWLEDPARKVDETHSGQHGEGLMETLAFHPSGDYFLMGGRLRGGKWNAALFNSADGNRIGEMDTKFRMTDSRFTSDGRIVVAGCKKQPKLENGKIKPWGRVQILAEA